MDASQGVLEIGDNCEIRDGARIYAYRVQIGNQVTLGEDVRINGDIKIKDQAWLSRNCDLSGKVSIERSILGPYVKCIGAKDHPRDSRTGAILMRNPSSEIREAPPDHEVMIQEGAWIGSSAILLKGVRVGRAAVVGAGAVVTKSCNDHQVIVGNPAKPISIK